MSSVPKGLVPPALTCVGGDAALLERARNVRSGTTDAAPVDEVLAALLGRYRAAEVDASYAAYDDHPLDEPDEAGDLASFRRSAAAS